MPAIEFEKETIGNILHSKKNLRVPINQRSYAWKPEHVTDLYNDLNAAITGHNEEYFLGSIIIVVTKTGDRIEVYDGQQRLATSMILISAIRDYFHRLKDKRTADSITSDSLLSVDRKTLELTTHFKLSSEDNEFFVNRILRSPDQPERKTAKPDPKKESHGLIQKAAKAAEAHIKGITTQLPSSADKAALLHRWLDFLDDGARVIWVEVADQRTAYRVFETMNDRGLKLSAADLLKNYLYSLANVRQDEVVQRWQAMTAVLESLGRDDGDLVDYIRYFWITSHGHTRSSELFDRIKAEVNSEATAVSFATDLELRSNDYAALLTFSHDAWNNYHQEVRATIDTIRYLGVSQIRPILLAAYGKFSKKELEKLLKVAVNWSVRCLLTGVPSGTLEGYYSKAAKKVTDEAIKSVDEITKEIAAIIPTDERFLAAATNASVPTASLARYYLRKLQMEEDGKDEPMYVPNDGTPVTLEHVLPVNPGTDWAHIPPDDIKANYNRLGNQALLAGSVNSKIGNVGFSAKKEALAKCEFTLTSSIAKLSEWRIQDIADRQAKLASLAVKTWPLLK
jgi:hypothetical protein